MFLKLEEKMKMTKKRKKIYKKKRHDRIRASMRQALSILLNFSPTVKAAPHECVHVIRTSQP